VAQFGSHYSLPIVASLVVILPVTVWWVRHEESPRPVSAYDSIHAARDTSQRIVTKHESELQPQRTTLGDSLPADQSSSGGTISQETFSDLLKAFLMRSRSNVSPADALHIARLGLDVLGSGAVSRKPYRDNDGFDCRDFAKDLVTFSIGSRNREGRPGDEELKFFMGLDPTVELPSPFVARRSGVTLTSFVLDGQPGVKCSESVIPQGGFPEAKSDEKVPIGCGFELSPSGSLYLTRYLATSDAEKTSVSVARDKESVTSDTKAGDAREFRQRLREGLGGVEFQPVPRLPSAIAEALAQIDKPSADLGWVSRVTQKFQDWAPPSEATAFLTSTGFLQYCCHMQNVPLSASCWRWLDKKYDLEDLFLEISVMEEALPPDTRTKISGDPKILFMARHWQGKYELFVQVEYLNKGRAFHLTEGDFQSAPCELDGEFTTLSLESLKSMELPSRSSGINLNTAEHWFTIISGYLPKSN
jgi:hypothetical protein